MIPGDFLNSDLTKPEGRVQFERNSTQQSPLPLLSSPRAEVASMPSLLPSEVTCVLCNSATEPASRESCDSSNELDSVHSSVAASQILTSIPTTDGWLTMRLPG